MLQNTRYSLGFKKSRNDASVSVMRYHVKGCLRDTPMMDFKDGC
jgi:hypothetical protein